MDLDNIQRKYGLPAPLPVVQNGKFAPRFPLNLEHRGDDVFQFGGKYIGEIENIYDLLYKILTNQEIDASLALPYAIKITEDKLYIRDKTNSEWILIFDITKPNFPKEIELYELIYKAITHQVIGEDTSYPGQFKIEENILYVRDKDNLTWTQIGDVTKEFLGATEATQAILEQVNDILTEVQELKTELNRQIATTNETLTTALKAANEAMISAQSINIRTFNSVEEMKASNTLKAGALAKTLGFYSAGDGGGADYVITNDIGEDEADEASIIALQKGLYAKLIINNLTNVAQLGAKNDGTENAINIFNIAKNAIGKVVIPNGIFNVDGELEDTILYFMGGTITGTLNVNNVEIQAPLDTIFGDITLTGQIKNNKVYPQWWGAKPLQIERDVELNSLHEIATDCSIAINKAISFAGTYNSEASNSKAGRNIGRPNVKLSKGFWRIDSGLTMDMIDISPSLVGDGMNTTVLDFSGTAQNTKAITISNGVGGTSNKSAMGYFRIYGNNTTTLLNLSDCLGYRFKEIMFDTCELACDIVNNKEGTYSEQNKFINCFFSGSAKQKFKFSVVNGSTSFHGFGIRNCFIEQFLDKAPMLEVTTGCAVYNAELDFQLMTEGSANPVIKHNGYDLNAKGTIQIEQYSTDFVLASPNRVFLLGNVCTWGETIKLGSLWLVDNYTKKGYSSYVLFKPCIFRGVLNEEKTFEYPLVNTGGTMYTVEVFTPNYAFRGCYIAYSDYNQGFTNIFKTLDERVILDGYSYGKPTINSGADAELIVTPSASLPSTATIFVVATHIGNSRLGVPAYKEV